ncbi:MAG TPA: adenylosuccinate lyase [Acidimicrobiia bacterium]|nr:adenylosuccinate lyase [Acidimicrobiia bacterium]
MIHRYALEPMAGLFTDEARYRTWLEVEILAVEAWAKLGVVPAAAAASVRERAAVDADAVEERERVTDHDVAAFVDVVQESVGPPAGAWVHYGLTSSDVVDTALSVTLVRACDLLIGAVAELEAAIAARALEHRATATVGRTHGIHAEPTTFGAKLALWVLQVRRDRERLARARAAVAVGKLSGAVGTYSNVDPEVEAFVCERLGLTPVPATQVIARDRHAELLYACASLGASIEAFALEIRHLQRTEVGEVEEPFRTGAQKGSSAMPHKRNPVKSEQLCGLARVLRANVVPGLEDVALWHERDISHSSVERIVLPDSLQLAYYVAVKFRAIVDGMVVHPDRMLENLDASYGLVFSQPVLLALVEAGLARDDAYRMVQRAAMRTWDERRPFLAVLEEDAEVRAALDGERLRACFDLTRALEHAGRTVDALGRLDPPAGAPLPAPPAAAAEP